MRISLLRLLAVMLTVQCFAACLTTSLSAQKVDFQKWVLPILEKNCFECHRETYRDTRGKLRKPKAGLRLDGSGWILRGSEEDKVVVPGKPDDSSLYYLTILEPDDGDIMPEDGDPLTKRQTEILRLWIEQGAKFGGWIGAVGPSAAEADVRKPVPVMPTPLYDRLGRGKTALSQNAIERAVGRRAQVSAVMPGSPLLQVAFRSYAAELDDARVKGFRKLSPYVTKLNLSRSAITDRSLKTVAGMKLLTSLDLHDTAITDRGVASLKDLKELRYLNLYATKVSDASVASLGAMKSLEAVYLWKTEVTAKGVAELRQYLPSCKIVYELDLPEAKPARAENDRGGKRKKRKQI